MVTGYAIFTTVQRTLNAPGDARHTAWRNSKQCNAE